MACLLTVLPFFTANAQSLNCGIYTKPAAASQSGPFYTDRFGNTFSEEELSTMLYNSTVLNCSSTSPFNVVIEGTTYQGNTFPTAEQESIICAVFSYLSDIIEAPGNGGTVNIQVVFDPSLVGSGSAGVGTPLFAQQCGIGYSIIQEQLNTLSPSLPSDFIHGYIYINPEFNWYTELDLNPPIGSTEIDLYTVMLHEALHVLGFASHVGAAGNAIDGFHSLYDLHLENAAGAGMILSTGTPGACCLEYEFNSAAFPNMPSDILDCGDVLVDVAQAPSANGQYVFTPPLSDALAANILSHLNITCGTEDYVMHSAIGFGAINTMDGTPNIRRTLTAAEREILCNIGYDMSPVCNASCFVIVRDDGPFVLNEPVETIPYAWLTANDFDADGNFQITFDFNCGDVGNMIFAPNNTTGELSVTLNNTPFGEYEFCYTIFSCNGELCESGTVEVIVAEEIDPSVCLGEDCNLVGYGDFELFPLGAGVYYPSFAEPWNNQIIGIPEINSDNSVDIFADGENQFLRFIRCNNCSIENVLIPLCETIPPDCEIKIEFDACADNSDNGNQPVTLGIWGFAELPEPMSLPTQTICNGNLMDNSGNLIGTCLGEVVLSQCDVAVLPNNLTVQPVIFSHYSINFNGGVSFPITHLWLFDYPSYSSFTEILIDNISVTTSCQNQITITPAVLEACIGGQAVIELEVCLDGELNTPADIAIAPDLQGIPGVSLGANNPDFPNGEATVEGLLPGQCVTLTLFLDIGPNFQPGTEITFPLDLEVTGACVENPDGQEVTFELEVCENLGCDCPSGSIVIGAPGVETLLSDLVSGNTLPANPPFGTPLNITVRGTLVVDANVVAGTQTGSYLIPPLSDICMDAGAEIRIPPNNTLSILDSHIRGCEKRWKSITVEGYATLNLQGDGLGLVEDGQYAVHPLSKSTVNITVTRFNKNYEALHFDDPAGEFVLQPFFGNTMQCTETLLPHYNSQDPNDGPWSFAGINTNGQDFLSIGVAGAAVNRFDALRNGIITRDCNLSLRNSRFSNIQRLDYTTAGQGVLATGTGQTFFQSGLLGNTTFFDDCDKGIFLRGMNAGVHNNVMNNVVTGVIVRESPNRDIEISGNTINCTSRGIDLWYNDPAQRIQVGYNVINVTSPVPDIKAAAIFVRENGAPQPNAHIEFHENIDIFNAGAGISLNGCNGYDVEQNFIGASQLGSLNYAGISLWNSPNNFLGCNRVDGDFETNPVGGLFGPSGIQARASTHVEYECNNLQDTRLGVRFDMGCGDTELRGTGLRNHRFGLHYSVTAVTGAQPVGPLDDLHGNRWNGAWGGANAVGARHESSIEDFVNLSQYVVPSISAPWGPQNPSSSSSTWFDDDPNRFEISCGITCDVWLTEDPPTTELDEQIARGLVDPGVYTEPMQWMLEWDLYRKLYANPELIVPESVFDTFYTAKSATAIERFIVVEAAIHSLFELDTNTAGQLQDYYEQITGQMENIGAIDSLLQTVSGQDSLNLLAHREVSLGMIDSISQLNSALVNSILQGRSAAANPVIAQNNAITVTEVWEQNEKTVNHIFLNTVVKRVAPNGTQLNLLRSVAAQCPYEGGVAVFRAWALLDGWTEDVFDDEAACGFDSGQHLIMPPLGNQEIATAINLYPNPAGNAVTVKMLRANEQEMELSLYSLYGQRVARHRLPEGTIEYSFSTDMLSQGFYLVRVMKGNEAVFTTRLVIAK